MQHTIENPKAMDLEALLNVASLFGRVWLYEDRDKLWRCNIDFNTKSGFELKASSAALVNQKQAVEQAIENANKIVNEISSLKEITQHG